MKHLPNDVCRCVGTTCAYRWRCKRFNDPEWPYGNDDPYAFSVPYADLSQELVPGIECRYLIEDEIKLGGTD